MVKDIQISGGTPYKSSGPFRFFALDKVTNKATCLVNGCGRQIKIFNFSPKEAKNHLQSKFHRLSDIEISQTPELTLDKYTKKKRLEGLIDKIARLATLSSISLNKIATDAEIRYIFFKLNIHYPRI